MIAAKAPPDGDTLTVGATGGLVINPHIPSSTQFDPLKELAPIAKLIDIPIVLVTNAKTGAKTVKELIEKSNSTPGGVSFGTTGVNSSQHLAVELLKNATGANLVHVPYRGSAPAVTAVLGDQIPMASVDLTSAYEHTKAGTLTALGVTSAHRAKIAPEIPTVAEGGVPGYDGSAGYIGLFAPAGTPPDKINAIVTRHRGDHCKTRRTGANQAARSRAGLLRRRHVQSFSRRRVGQVEGRAEIASGRKIA